ncbi:MAG TPA: MBL fold metallo-hydrolase [Streptosporangiaceae bacterium]
MSSENGGARAWPLDFRDRLTSPVPAPKPNEVLRLARGGMSAADAASSADIPVRRAPAPEGAATSATWVGHATFVLRVGGLTILTDPVWSRRIPGIKPRLTPPGVPLGSLDRVDAVVISHNHYDHLDAPTIRRLPRSATIFVPAKLASWFTRRGFRRVVELDWWESASLPAPGGGTVAFDLVPAHHWSRRGMFDGCRTLWGGWVITAPNGDRAYFAGDTGYGHWFAEIAARYPGIDLALLPIGAYEPRWFLKNVHMDPEEAVQAAGDLGARRMATMHWGTFRLSAEPPTEPLARVRKAWHDAGRDPADLWDLAVGEGRALESAQDDRRG